MKYLDEYRDEKIARALAQEIRERVTRAWVLMEICGGQTHTIMRYGIDELLPREVELVHGPGCPVCVTSPGNDRQGSGACLRSELEPGTRSMSP